MPAYIIGPKVIREQQTVQLMIKLYCRKLHDAEGELCEFCKALEAYALRRLALCRYGENKPICAQCSRHCYRSDYKDDIRKVMRYAGPRMIVYHPLCALRHLIKEILKN